MKTMEAEIQHDLDAMPAKNVPNFRRLRRVWSRRLKDRPGPAVIALAKRLVRLGLWERGMAYEIILHHQKALEALKPEDVRRLGQGISGWGEVDGFACHVAGVAWRLRRVPDSMVKGWARSHNRWWRRAALVSTVPLNRPALGGRGDAARTLMICRMLAPDRDDMVVKALSWALRELCRWDRPAVEGFLEKHRLRLPARVKREVRNKLETGLKNPARFRMPGRRVRMA